MAKSLFLIFLTLFFSTNSNAQSRVDVSLVTDEAEAVLRIVQKNSQGLAIADSEWEALFRSEGYVRLKKREASVKRPFEDSDFRQFVLSKELRDKLPQLRTTLEQWRKISVDSSARQALAYLPATAKLSAKVYPVIKPRDNSFVFEVRSNPAIFLYLDPAVSKEEFANTLAHELHHIGFGNGCSASEIDLLPPNKKTAAKWLGAFGEGLAMLAAAGGPYVHPHKFSKLEDREQWDKDMLNLNADMAKVQAFFSDVLAERLVGEKIDEAGFSFFGTHGPWYTVGWQMSVVIEETFGRERVIDAFCDVRKLIPTYNEAVQHYNRKHKADLAQWPVAVVAAFK